MGILDGLLGADIQPWIAPALGAVGLIVFFMSEGPVARFVGALMGIVGGLITLFEIWRLHGLPLWL